MFWSSFADIYSIGGRIETSWMDGTNRDILVAKNSSSSIIYWPVSLTYYKETNMLYWLDVLTQTIESITLDKEKIRGQKKILSYYTPSLAILAGRFFWSDNMNKNIEEINIDSKDIGR